MRSAPTAQYQVPKPVYSVINKHKRGWFQGYLKESFASSQTRCLGWPTVSRRACSLALMTFTCTKVDIKITYNVGVEVQFKRYKVTSRSTGTFLHVASLHKGVQTAEVIPERCFPRAFGVTVYLHTVSAQSDSGMHK
jgi:hypothetical protein